VERTTKIRPKNSPIWPNWEEKAWPRHEGPPPPCSSSRPALPQAPTPPGRAPTVPPTAGAALSPSKTSMRRRGKGRRDGRRRATRADHRKGGAMGGEGERRRGVAAGAIARRGGRGSRVCLGCVLSPLIARCRAGRAYVTHGYNADPRRGPRALNDTVKILHGQDLLVKVNQRFTCADLCEAPYGGHHIQR
jgi:hypothetical protein